MWLTHFFLTNHLQLNYVGKCVCMFLNFNHSVSAYPNKLLLEVDGINVFSKDVYTYISVYIEREKRLPHQRSTRDQCQQEWTLSL